PAARPADPAYRAHPDQLGADGRARRHDGRKPCAHQGVRRAGSRPRGRRVPDRPRGRAAQHARPRCGHARAGPLARGRAVAEGGGRSGDAVARSSSRPAPGPGARRGARAVATRVLEDAATALHRTLLADLEGPRSEVRVWIVERLERARRALAGDEDLRRQLDQWVKGRVIEAVERHHQRLAEFIENGVRALGPEGAVRLIEEHAGDDLQYIRVNGTVVGGLAGGLLYAVHLLLRLL